VQRNWSNTNVDLNLLVKEIIKFFEENYFEVTVNKTESDWQVLAGRSPNYEINGQVAVTIEGKPNEFSIRTELHGKKESKTSSLPTLLTTLLGGGYFILQRCRSDEAWIELKKDLWEHMNRSVMLLSGSASNPAKSS
jgi:hypothetical protein